jgi:hypothetical protein
VLRKVQISSPHFFESHNFFTQFDSYTLVLFYICLGILFWLCWCGIFMEQRSIQLLGWNLQKKNVWIFCFPYIETKGTLKCNPLTSKLKKRRNQTRESRRGDWEKKEKKKKKDCQTSIAMFSFYKRMPI